MKLITLTQVIVLLVIAANAMNVPLEKHRYQERLKLSSDRRPRKRQLEPQPKTIQPEPEPTAQQLNLSLKFALETTTTPSSSMETSEHTKVLLLTAASHPSVNSSNSDREVIFSVAEGVHKTIGGVKVTTVKETTSSYSSSIGSRSNRNRFHTTVSIKTTTTTKTTISFTSSNSYASYASPSGLDPLSFYAAMGKGITYSPYHDNFQCKSHEEIQNDFRLLASFDIIRLYAPDCDCVNGVMKAMLSHQQIFAGLFYMDTIESDVQLLVDQVNENQRGWDGVYAVSVGNEWINSGQHGIHEVTKAVAQARLLLKQKGYHGPVVNVDTVPAYMSNKQLCGISDIITVNAHAYWDGGVKPENSAEFLQGQVTQLENFCGNGKKILITESGWPTKGQTYGSVAVPGTLEQLACIESIVKSAIADQVILFTFYDDYWKQPGPYGVEQNWGLFK